MQDARRSYRSLPPTSVPAMRFLFLQMPCTIMPICSQPRSKHTFIIASVAKRPRQWPSQIANPNHTRDIMCQLFEYQVAVAVHCQHTVKGHPYGSSGKPWDDWSFPTCLKCLALSRTWPWPCHAMPFFLQTDWDEGPRGACCLRLARKQMWHYCGKGEALRPKRSGPVEK
jgi:hypothetical protein